MRKHGLLSVFILLILTACDYDAPLVGEASLLFIVVSYALDNGQLVVRSLNTDLVNTDLADTAALQAAFAANRNDPSLFHEPAQFRKLSEGSDNFPRKW